MNKVSTPHQLARLVSYIALQLALANRITLLHTGFCFVYVGFLLSMPWRQVNLVASLFLGFAVGCLLDLFYDTLGLHAFACVLLVYARAFLLKRMLPLSSYETGAQPTLNDMGIKSFSIFVLVLVALHHGALFGLDAWDSALWGIGLRKAALSTILTYLAVVTVQKFALLVRSQ